MGQRLRPALENPPLSRLPPVVLRPPGTVRALQEMRSQVHCRVRKLEGLSQPQAIRGPPPGRAGPGSNEPRPGARLVSREKSSKASIQKGHWTIKNYEGIK